jgi:hypothetical protein
MALPLIFSAIIAGMKSFKRGNLILVATLVVGVTCIGQVVRAQAPSSDDVQALVKQGQKLNSEGKQDEALKVYKQALEKSPNSYEAHLESGVALDLKGDYTAARSRTFGHLRPVVTRRTYGAAWSRHPCSGAVTVAIHGTWCLALATTSTRASGNPAMVGSACTRSFATGIACTWASQRAATI